MNAMIITDHASDESMPLATFTVQLAKEGSASEVDALYLAFRELLGIEKARWIAFQTFDEEVLFYGNVMTSFIGTLMSNRKILTRWFASMHIISARAAVLHFTLHPCLGLSAPFLDDECEAIEKLNRYLSTTGRLMATGNCIERCGSDQTTLVENCPPHRWFMGITKNEGSR